MGGPAGMPDADGVFLGGIPQLIPQVLQAALCFDHLHLSILHIGDEMCIRDRIHAVEEKKTINHVYLVGCGASFAVFKPVEFYLNRETEIPTTAITANEFNYATPKSLGEESVVVTCSHSGSTPETLSLIHI